MSFYDEIEIEDMTFDPKLQIYHYPCPCGDRFEIAVADLRDGEDVAVCPSCSLMIKVIFEVVSCLLWCCDWIWRSRGKANYRDTFRTVYQKKRLRVNHRRW
jgi:diphthamide biosynthesis protein 3